MRMLGILKRNIHKPSTKLKTKIANGKNSTLFAPIGNQLGYVM
jgi:hypothetical protein